MRISFFDTSSQLYGWCTGNGCAIPKAGAFALTQSNDDYGKMLAELEKYLTVHFDTFQPEFVGYESPIHKPNDKLHNLRKLYSVGAFLEYFCHLMNVPCEEVSVQGVKKTLTGDRFAKKEAMVASAKYAGIRLPDPSDGEKDAADAFGGWLHLQNLKDEDAKKFWAQRVRKGGLL